MLPVVDTDCGRRTARAILRHTMYLSSIPIVASLSGITSSMFAIESLAFNSYIIYLATRFHKKRSNRNAQQVFRSSLWYLPLTLSLMVYHSKNWSDKDVEESEETSIDRFVDVMRDRLTDLCPHELFSRGDIKVDAENMCPPTMIAGPNPLRSEEVEE